MLDNVLYVIELLMEWLQGRLFLGVYGIRGFRRRLKEPSEKEKRRSEIVKGQLEARLTAQERCALRRHTKGTSKSSSYVISHDLNVYMHTMIGGDTRIWCGRCGWQVWDKPATGQTREEWAAKWKEGLELVELTSNHQSSSERPIPGATIVVAQPVHGNDKYAPGQIRLKEDEGPISGSEQADRKWNLEGGDNAVIVHLP